MRALASQLSLWLLLTGCSSLASQSIGADGRDCQGLHCGGDNDNPNDYTLVVDAGVPSGSDAGVAGLSRAQLLCGVADDGSTCLPDDAESCAQAGARGADPDQAGAGSWTQEGSSRACQVRQVGESLHAACELAGTGQLGEPCVTLNGCMPGLSCIDQEGTAQCRAYCCGDPESCPTGTYCDLRPLREQVSSAVSQLVPVCVASQDCRLDDPYPCPDGVDCGCPEGRSCTVVRPDGTTACVEPGTGAAGEPCPCAAGHVCSEASGTCLKVCLLQDSATSCETGHCQSSPNLGSEWGVCVGTATVTE